MVSVIVYDGRDSFIHDLQVKEGASANFFGEVRGRKSGADRRFVFNAVLKRGPSPDVLELQYQVELAGATREDPSPMQAQGLVAIRRDVGLPAVECAGWKVFIQIDRAANKGRKNPAQPKDALPNFQVSADLTRGAERVTCAQVLKDGAQGNVVHQTTGGPKKTGFMLNSVLANLDEGVELQVRLEHTSPQGGEPLKVQDSPMLVLGRKTTLKGEGYSLDLKVDPAP